MRLHYLALCGAALFLNLVVAAHAAENMVPDASFEAPIPNWFSSSFVPNRDSYFLDTVKADDAPDGQHVLQIQGWDLAGSKIMSPPMDFAGDTFSATCKLCSFNVTGNATLELALFDESGSEKLASFGTTTLDGTGAWVTVKNTAKLARRVSRGRLTILLAGPQRGARVQLDQLGLFAGNEIGRATDETDFAAIEAEDLANGKSWVVQNHYLYQYSGLPSGMKMLAGPNGVTEADNLPAKKSVQLHNAGKHRLWVRLINNGGEGSKYTISLAQNGKTVASREIDDSSAALGPAYSWVWVSIDAVFEAGSADILLTRPAATSSWLGRKIDLLVLTNLLNYTPQVEDFKTRAYLRFTNLSQDQEPLTLWTYIQHPGGPVFDVVPGILSQAGFSGSYYAYDSDKWLAPGQSSPWVKVSQFLAAQNLVAFLATRKTHTEGLVSGRLRGRLEFASGEDRKIIKTVEIDQTAPRFLMTLPLDIANQGNEILTATDYIARAESALDEAKVSSGTPAVNLDLHANLNLDAALDDPKVIEGEIKVLKRMGFNGTFIPVTAAKDALAFTQKYGLRPHFGLWANAVLFKNSDLNQPDIDAMDSVYRGQAEKHGPMLGKVERMTLMDEPNGPSYQHLASCDFCKQKFRDGLRAKGQTPEMLGVKSWDEVVPILPARREEHPALFYQTALFRLQAFADLVKASVAIKKKYLPDNVKTLVNYAPDSWVQRGIDPWLAQRDGGLEMGWSEDWLAYGVSPQQGSPLYAELRSAVHPSDEALGGYVVGVDGGPLLLRMKYYEMVANGARHINVYSYGPSYLSADSWSTRYSIFPAIARVQNELGRIDVALNGTRRRRTKIAVLNNRTASIWAVDSSVAEQDTRFIQWALAHAGYDADVLAEEDVMAGALKNYDLFYANGVQMRHDVAGKIAQWVQGGGTLVGGTGVATRDELDAPSAILESIFGAKSKDLKFVTDAGRPKYEMRTLAALNELSSVPGSGPGAAASPGVALSAVTFNQLCYQETLIPDAGAKVILKTGAGEAAGVMNSVGKGRAIRFAAPLGIAYVNEAVRDKDYDIESYLPQKYRTQLRDLIAWPAALAKVQRVARANSPIAEVTRYDAADHAVLFVIDHNAKPRLDFSLRIPNAGQFSKAFTATGKAVKLSHSADGVLIASWPLDVTDVLVLQK